MNVVMLQLRSSVNDGGAFGGGGGWPEDASMADAPSNEAGPAMSARATRGAEERQWAANLPLPLRQPRKPAQRDQRAAASLLSRSEPPPPPGSAALTGTPASLRLPAPCGGAPLHRVRCGPGAGPAASGAQQCSRVSSSASCKPRRSASWRLRRCGARQRCLQRAASVQAHASLQRQRCLRAGTRARLLCRVRTPHGCTPLPSLPPARVSSTASGKHRCRDHSARWEQLQSRIAPGRRRAREPHSSTCDMGEDERAAVCSSASSAERSIADRDVADRLSSVVARGTSGAVLRGSKRLANTHSASSRAVSCTHSHGFLTCIAGLRCGSLRARQRRCSCNAPALASRTQVGGCCGPEPPLSWPCQCS